MPAKITLAKAEWCPYTCENSQQPGIIHEYVGWILEQHGIQMNAIALPWARALRLASIGQEVHGLLTAVFLEAPNLLLTNVPTAHFQNCFVARKGEDWKYVDPVSLQTMPKGLGVIKDYAYGEPLDGFISNNKAGAKIQTVTGVDGADVLLHMLIRKRLKLLIEEHHVVSWHLKYHAEEKELVEFRGCLAKQPFYLAINPSFSWSAELIVKLNKAFADPENQKFLKDLEAKYLKRHS